jgi:hypothetical protein
VKKANNVEKREYKEKRQEWHSISDTQKHKQKCVYIVHGCQETCCKREKMKSKWKDATSDIYGTYCVLIRAELPTDPHCAPAVDKHKNTDLSHT